MAKKVAIIIASQGYQPTEYEVPKKMFHEAGFKVVTVSNKPGNAVAKDNTTTPVELDLKDLRPVDFDGLIFIGGPGALEHLDNDLSYRKIQEAVELDKLVAGICVAPRILAKAGALVAKKATGWDEDHQLHAIFQKHAVIQLDQDIVTDGKVITARGPQDAAEFAHAILTVI